MPDVPPSPTLSKSRFSAGLQCLRRLYLEVYHPELAPEPSAAQQALFDTGNRVGALARKLFPGGLLIETPYDRHSEAVEATGHALSDASIPATYEAAFAHEGIRIRCDVLQRNGDGSFDLFEVKSSSRVKDEHIPDVAIQLHVVEGAGVRVRAAHVLHINTAYVYLGGDYDLHGLFQADDVTSEAREFLRDEAPGKLAAMWEALRSDEAPAVGTGARCENPYLCPFYDYCHQDFPEFCVEQLPHLSGKLRAALAGAGIVDIRRIPPGFSGLSAMQQRVQESVVGGRPFVSGGLADALAQVREPLHFLDFEAVNPALPLFPGTRPFQAVPFQWSLHTLDSDGKLRHQAFLHGGRDDPRPAFAESLLSAVDGDAPIVVYATYEATRLNDLAQHIPSRAAGIQAVRSRLFDLLRFLREHYYHPGQHGSFSLKDVLPALAPDLGYGDLLLREGSAAALAYEKMLWPDTPQEERERLRQALLDYCQRDTLALVKVLKALRAQVG
ncbi:MAG: DUF2779 domain-containing protein [Chloroflexi bacterium]|nr:DUF2779 domain-containing protein [Chloroflexota bacterium]